MFEQAARTSVLLMTSFTLCWLPLFVVMMLEAIMTSQDQISAPIQAGMKLGIHSFLLLFLLNLKLSSISSDIE